MGTELALLLALVFSGVALGEETEAVFECPPTIVDCACTEKDGNFYTIQINTTTISISDEDTGLDRCIADGDPLALCEDRNCIIIPNDNFNILFKMGRKMSPSNYLQADDLDFENETSSSSSNNTDPKAGPGPSKDMESAFYPIELTYPRMIHGEESHLIMKRSNQFNSGGFIAPPKDSNFGDDKYGKKDLEPLKSHQDLDFGDDQYKKRESVGFRPPKDFDILGEKNKNRDHDVLRPRPVAFLADEKYKNDPFRNRPGSNFSDDEYKRKDSNPFRHSRDPVFGNADNGLNSSASMHTESHKLPPMRPQKDQLTNRQYVPYLSQDSSYSNNNPVNWGGAYGHACRIPQLKNSEITCWKWPNWQTCKQSCIYGHGIASSRGTLRSTTFTCRNTENHWQPNNMVDCQPYLNCKVRLQTPGDLKCVEPTDRPAYCDVMCEEYDNHSAQTVRVTCDETMGGMQLPFCASLDNSFMNHVRAPAP